MEFYSLLVENLIKNTQYRVILSAITWDGPLDFMLVSLFLRENMCDANFMRLHLFRIL